MTLNPYESPQNTSAVPTAIQTVAVENRRFGLFQMIAIGLVVGAVWGGFCGAIASGLLGLVGSLLGPPTFFDPERGQIPQDPAISFAFIGAWLGAWCGALSGAPIGLLIGIVVASVKRTYWRRLGIIGGLLASIGGAIFGLAGGAILGDVLNHHRTNQTLFISLGGLIGTVAGLFGGAVLGRVLGRIAWGPPVVAAATRA
jgi:hypothetical protein